jgi:hypothetical protein
MMPTIGYFAEPSAPGLGRPGRATAKELQRPSR